MKILTIIVHQASGEILSTTNVLHSLWKTAEEKFIKEQLLPIAGALEGEHGIHELSTLHGIFYAYIANDKFAFVASDEKIPADMQLGLFDKIRQATSSRELVIILKDPVQAAKTKPQLVLEEIENLKPIMMSNIEKLIARQEKLEYILLATEELAQNGIKFKDRATKLRRQSQCPFFYPLFSFFSSVKAKVNHYVWPEQKANIENAEITNATNYNYKPTRN